MPPKRAASSGVSGGGLNSNVANSKDPNAISNLLLQQHNHQLQQQQSSYQEFIETLHSSSSFQDDDIRSFILSASVTIAPSQFTLAQTAMQQSLDFVQDQHQQANTHNNNERTSPPPPSSSSPLFIPECHTVSVEYYVPKTAFDALATSISAAKGEVNNSASAGKDTTAKDGAGGKSLESSLSKAQIAQMLAQVPPISAIENAQALLINPNCLPALNPFDAASSHHQHQENEAASYDPKKDWVCVGKNDLVSPFTFMTKEQQQEYFLNNNNNNNNNSNSSQQQSSQQQGSQNNNANSQQGGAKTTSSKSNKNANIAQNDARLFPSVYTGPITNAFLLQSNNNNNNQPAEIKTQKYTSSICQQKRVMIPAPNFVKDFLCGEFVAVLIVSSLVDKENFVETAIQTCGQDLPIVTQVNYQAEQKQLLLKQQQQQQEQLQSSSAAKKTGPKTVKTTSTAINNNNASKPKDGKINNNNATTSSSSALDDPNSNNPNSHLEFSTFSFVFNFGAGLFANKSELLHVENPNILTTAELFPSGGAATAFYGKQTSFANNNNKNNNTESCPKQFENIPGIESFSITLESDENLLSGRNKRRFPVAIFDIQSMNDAPPPNLSLPPPTNSLQNQNQQHDNSSNFTSSSAPHGGTAVDLKINTISPSTNVSNSNNAAAANATVTAAATQQSVIMNLDSSRVHQMLSQSNVAAPRIAFLWNNQVIFTPRGNFSGPDNHRKHNNGSRWLFNYSRPVYAGYGTTALEAGNGSAFALVRHLWYNTLDFAIFDNETKCGSSSSWSNNTNNNKSTANIVNNSFSSAESGRVGGGSDTSSTNTTSRFNPNNNGKKNLVPQHHHSNLLQESLQLPSSPPSAFAKLSLRDFVEIGATFVEETVPVLPERPEVSFAITQVGTQKIRVPHYVAFGTTLKCRVRLSAPVPFPVFVPPVPRNLLSTTTTTATATFKNNNNALSSIAVFQPSQVKKIVAPFENPSPGQPNPASACFLTRIVLTLPYRSEMTKNVLRAVYSYLMKSNKSNKTSDLFELPMLNPEGTDFLADHFVDSVQILAAQKAAELAATFAAGNTGKGSKQQQQQQGQGQSQQQQPRTGSAGNKRMTAQQKLLAEQQAQLEQQQKGFSEKEIDAIKNAHQLEDAELAFHPFGNCYRRRIFVSVPDEVSGVELIDGDVRVVIIEAPCPVVAKVADLATEVAGPDLHSLRMLFNYELPFLRRDYHVWPPLVRPLQQTSHQALLKQQQAQAQQQAHAQAEHLKHQLSQQQQHQKRGSSAERSNTPTKSTKPSGNSSKQTKPTAPTTSKPKGAKEEDQQANQQESSKQQQPDDSDAATTIISQQKLSSFFGGAGAASSTVTTMDPLPDLDPGALGGRIRRVRLSCTLQSILKDPAQFLKRSLPGDAIEAAVRVASLAGIQHAGVLPPATMLDALNRNLFPSQSSLVSLERACGDCLSTEDVCSDGENWKPFARDVDVDKLVEGFSRERMEKATENLREQQLLANHAKNMSAGRLPRVGTVLSFIGIPATAKDLGLALHNNNNNHDDETTRKFPPIEKVAQQYPKSRKSYVRVISASFMTASSNNKNKTGTVIDPTETATTVSTSGGDKAICWPCVFPTGVVLTNQPIRFEITGQVVPAKNNANNEITSSLIDPAMTSSILFVLDCKAYSAQGSDCRNPEFEKKKLHDKRIVAPKEYEKIMTKRAKKFQEEEEQQDNNNNNSNNKNKSRNLSSLQGDEPEGKQAALSLRASYETKRKKKQNAIGADASGNNNNANANDEDDHDYTSSDGEDDSPPQHRQKDSARSAAHLPISQKNWHSMTLEEMRNKSLKNSLSKDDDTMQQAAKYQRAAELYQKQDDQLRAREAVIENLRANLADRPPFRSHHLATSSDDNRHPKALGEPLASRDETPIPLAMRGGGVGNGNGNSSLSGAAVVVLPPMKFVNSSQAFDSNAAFYSSNTDNKNNKTSGVNVETEDELFEQRRQRLEKQQEDWKRKLVVADPVFHVTTRKPRDHPLLQVDAQTGSMLHGEPQKKSIKMAYAPPPPISLREGTVDAKQQHINPKTSKHPDQRQFVYTKNLTEPLPKKMIGISEGEKAGPLWGK